MNINNINEQKYQKKTDLDLFNGNWHYHNNTRTFFTFYSINIEIHNNIMLNINYDKKLK